MDALSPFAGEIGIWPVPAYIPRGWAACDGSLLKITDYPVLFNLLGTTYGGDGQTTFALPDLRGRTAVGVSSGPGGYVAGETGGAQRVRLTVGNLPAHSHQIWATDTVSDVEPPLGAIPGFVNGTHNKYFRGTADVAVAADSFLPSGNDQPHDNLQPFLALTYVICLEGIFPS